MKEIKFRAWVESKGVMQEAGPLDYWFQASILLQINPWPQSIFMQYTGLKDRNGKDIYEGDIALFGSTPIEINFPEDYKMIATQLDQVEVIGNIYENPELLKEVSA